MQFISISLLIGVAVAAPAATTPFSATELTRRAFSFPIPASKGSVTLSAAQKVSGTFDGGMKTYGRGVSCTGQAEGGDKDAVFILANGATLKNVIIGKDQIEGVHCTGSCTIENVWWTDVCEDALSFKGDGSGTVKGGGARNADDKIFQHNGFGTITVDGFVAQDFGKLYRSCGNCKGNGKARSIVLKNVKALNGKALVGINTNYGDKASFSNTCAQSVKELCVTYTGNNNGAEPPKVGKCSTSGISTSC